MALVGKPRETLGKKKGYIMGKWRSYMVLWDSHGNIWGYPLAICSIAIENDTVIVDLPINDGDFPQLC